MDNQIIYTVGHKQNYLFAIENSEDGYIYKVGKDEKYDGGFVTDNLDDCFRIIREKFPNRQDQFCVFGLEDIDYEKDTYSKNGEWFKRLLKDAKIIVLDI